MNVSFLFITKVMAENVLCGFIVESHILWHWYNVCRYWVGKRKSNSFELLNWMSIESIKMTARAKIYSVWLEILELLFEKLTDFERWCVKTIGSQNLDRFYGFLKALDETVSDFVTDLVKISKMSRVSLFFPKKAFIWLFNKISCLNFEIYLP